MKPTGILALITLLVITESNNVKKYFEVVLQAFSSIRKIVDDSTTVVQLIGFSDPIQQLPKYLDIMESAGFKEVALNHNSIGNIKRLWRNVPNRKWYVDVNGKYHVNRRVHTYIPKGEDMGTISISMNIIPNL